MKKITLELNVEDIPNLLKSGLSSILQRNGTKREEICKKIDEAINQKLPEDIAEGLKDLININNALAEESAGLVPLIKNLREESGGSDTQILEDLPDLEEDGLRVDSGRE